MTSRTVVLVTTLLAAVLGLSACSGGKNAVDQSSGNQFRYVQANKKGSVIEASERKLAGPVAGTLLTGGNYRLSDDRGKVVVLNFFASWCPPCQLETPQFDSIYRERKSSGVQFIGMDVKDPSKSAAMSWIKDKDVTFPVVYDEAARSAIQLGDVPMAALPSTIVIDRQGRVAAVYVGAVLPKDLTAALDELTKEV
ncbi:MAG TPA: TlpA disulfide reductase family protein [Jatrophihabitans sp.]|jgi:peroxiredoxin|uniref:TlpA disulfide reductase family protein n=1 Tax=Jatrophihabitans sp. TaxID=1932789 RepID=UPI002F20B022